MNYRRYGFDIYQESSKKDISIDDEDVDVEGMDAKDDIDEEDDEKPKKKSKSSKTKKTENEDVDIDLDDTSDEEDDEKPKKKKKSKNKNADIVDDDDDVDFEDECGDGCSPKIKCESAKDKKDNNEDADIDFDDMGSDDVPDKKDDEEEKPKKKSSKAEKDVDFDDEDEECDDENCDDEEDEEDDKKSKSSKKKSSKSKKKDDDIDLDVDVEEECGDGGCSPKQFKEYVAQKKQYNRNADIDDYDDNYLMEGATTTDVEMGDVDEGGSNEGDDIDVDATSECGDVVFKGESSKSKDEDKDVDFNDDDEDSDEDEECDDENCDDEEDDEDEDDKKSKSSKKKSSKSKKKDDEEDDENNDVDFDEEAAHPVTASKDFVKPVLKEHDDTLSEYAIDLIKEAELKTERMIMTELIDSIYKEYEIMNALPDEYFAEYDEESEDGEVVQERYIGGLGKKASDIVKPLAKKGKYMNEKKHGVSKTGLIRNTFNLTGKDLKKGGILYKLFTWPFLIIKNLGKTIYHKTKAFTAYTSTLRAIEIKINREITHLKSNVNNIPGTAVSAGVGYVATTAASAARGEGIQVNPIEFIASEGSKLIESLGHDNMLRGLTYKLASVIEDSPDKIGVVLRESREKRGKSEKITPSMAKDSKDIISVTNGKTNMNGVINMKGVDQLLNDIDDWGEIAENMIDDVSENNKEALHNKLSKLKAIEDRYMHHGKIRTEAIFSEKGGTVKIADFYEEISVKLSEKAKQLENGLKNMSEVESLMNSDTAQINSDIKKIVVEMNTLIQHTCNYFMEIIDIIDDFGKYAMNTMKQYLNCLEQTSEEIRNKSNVTNDEKPKKRHKLFHKHELENKENEE